MLFIRRFLKVSWVASVIILLLLIVKCLGESDVILKEDDYFNEFSILLKEGLNNYDTDSKDNNLSSVSYNKNTYIISDEDIFFELYIPRISLRKFVYTIDSSKNNVDFNIELLNETDESLNLYFLASHSGGGKASYFDNLIYLNKGDIIWIYKGGRSLMFVVDDIYYIEKNGYFHVNYGSNGGQLFLITCSVVFPNKQLVVMAKIVYS